MFSFSKGEMYNLGKRSNVKLSLGNVLTRMLAGGVEFGLVFINDVTCFLDSNDVRNNSKTDSKRDTAMEKYEEAVKLDRLASHMKVPQKDGIVERIMNQFLCEEGNLSYASTTDNPRAEMTKIAEIFSDSHKPSLDFEVNGVCFTVSNEDVKFASENERSLGAVLMEKYKKAEKTQVSPRPTLGFWGIATLRLRDFQNDKPGLDSPVI